MFEWMHFSIMYINVVRTLLQRKKGICLMSMYMVVEGVNFMSYLDNGSILYVVTKWTIPSQQSFHFVSVREGTSIICSIFLTLQRGCCFHDSNL